MNQIKAVWIEVGCTCCQACVHSLPSVFRCPDSEAEILGAVRVDGTTCSNNEARSDLNDLGHLLTEEIIEAAAGCPVDVIKYAMTSNREPDRSLSCGALSKSGVPRQEERLS
jgi:ferredoxin